MRSARILRLLRLYKLKRLLQDVEDRISSEILWIIMGLCQKIFYILGVNHLIACMWWGVSHVRRDNEPSWVSVAPRPFEDEDLGYKYFTSLHWSLAQFTPAPMRVQPENLPERIFAVLVITFALVIFSSFVSTLTAAITALRSRNSQKVAQMFMLRRYLKTNQVPMGLQRRVLRYVEYRQSIEEQKVSGRQVALLKMLSLSLRQELHLAVVMPDIDHHCLFNRLRLKYTNNLQVMVQNAMGRESFAWGDPIFEQGHQAKAMYFLVRGVVEYQHPGKDQREAEKFESRHAISEAALWTDWKHHGRLVAAIECEMLLVEVQKFRNDVKAQSSNNPNLAKLVSRYAKAYVDEFNKVLAESPGEASDILEVKVPEHIMPTPRLTESS